MLQNYNSLPTMASSSAYHDRYSTDIDLVSLTICTVLFVLFDNLAITLWLSYIQNVRFITFIRPLKD